MHNVFITQKPVNPTYLLLLGEIIDRDYSDGVMSTYHPQIPYQRLIDKNLQST